MLAANPAGQIDLLAAKFISADTTSLSATNQILASVTSCLILHG
jgi:hypothetical protein